MKKKSKYLSYKFIRYGGANEKTQKGYDPSMPTYHRPPARKGIYAFPEKAVEYFLLGGTYGGISFEERFKRNQTKFKKNKSDLIWHHLGKHLNPFQILEEKGSWCLSTVKDWGKAFIKESLILRQDGANRNISEQPQPGPVGSYAKDHLEVFFEKNS